MPEFVERDLGGSFHRVNPDVIFDGNNFEAEKRRRNRKRIERQQTLRMPPVGGFNEHTQEGGKADFNEVNNFPKRRTRGRGRKINYR